MKRRNFIKVAVAAGLGSNAVRALAQQSQGATEVYQTAAGSMLPRAKDPGELRGEMLYRLLGRTGERVSAIGLGGSHIGKPALSPSESIRLFSSWNVIWSGTQTSGKWPSLLSVNWAFTKLSPT